MLALPVVTGLAGFFPALVVSLLCCLFMMATGLLFLEVILWMEDGANVLTLANHFLGKSGKFISGATFLFLYYCLEVSYCAGGAPAFSKILSQLFGFHLSGFPSYLVFALTFGFIVYLGTKAIDRINWLLMTGLFLSFICLIGLGSREVKVGLLQRTNWSVSLLAAPILFGAYGYHNLLPSLSSYLRRNLPYLRFSVIFGTFIPFVIYSIWQWMIIGTLSLDEIRGADVRGEPITQALQGIVQHPWLVLFGELFGFFALITSFLGVSLSMVDFLADGMNIRRDGWYRIFLCSLVFIPPVLFATLKPDIFIEAIGLAGGFGEAILNGLLPIGMVWVGRYMLKLPSDYRLWGGRKMLILLLLVTILIMGVEAHHLLTN
jgi:tyrosine-specific transport protein